MSEHKEGDLRVWHVPQIGVHNEFHVYVPDTTTAVTVLEALAKYDSFLHKSKLRESPINANGLEVYLNGEWKVWEDSNGRYIQYDRWA